MCGMDVNPLYSHVKLENYPDYQGSLKHWTLTSVFTWLKISENIIKYSHHERFRSYQTSQFTLISYKLLKSGKWLTFRENIYTIWYQG
jgi:hypothetical protein